MLHQRKKIAKIVEELTIFFFSIDSTEVNSQIAIENQVATIIFEANYDPQYAYKFESMSRLLLSKRDETLEDEYWALAGSGDPGESSQLLLIGVMADKTEIEISDSKVKIVVRKKIS